MRQNTFAAGAPLGKLTALPRLPNWIWRREEGEGREGRGSKGRD